MQQPKAPSTVAARMEVLSDLMAPVEDVEKEAEEITIQAEEENEDIAPLRVARGSNLPSADDVESHRCSHVPFRSWCRWCIMGRGRGDPHLRTAGSSIPIVGLYYFFIGDETVKTRDELDFAKDEADDAALEAARASGNLIKCLVVRCATTKCLFRHVIPCTGADEEDFVANLVADDIIWLGHAELIIKGDNEPALQALTARLLEVVRVKAEQIKRISTETPPAYDSQANGGVEVGVMLIRGLFRTLKLCLESRIDRSIPADHSVVPWLLQHTCLILTIQSRGVDGLTS